jgi:hypothetical protein
MRIAFIGVLLTALVLSSGLGCAAQQLVDAGKKLEATGDAWGASHSALDALDADANHEDAGKMVRRTARPAFAQHLHVAEQLEQERRHAEAFRAYADLHAFVERVRARTGLLLDVDVTAKMAQMREAAVDDAYRLAERAFADGHWSDAIGHYRVAQGFGSGPATSDTQEKIGACFTFWADDDVKAHRYRAAIEHYKQGAATQTVAAREGWKRAATIHIAYAETFVRSGGCRKAVRELGAAQELAPRLVDPKLLEAAHACARVDVGIPPLENRTRYELAGMSMGDAIAERTAARVQQTASPFLQLVERRRARYLALGTITQLYFDAPAERVTHEHVEIDEECRVQPKDPPAGTPTKMCPLRVDYWKHEAQQSLRFGGSLRIVDTATGAQVAVLPFDLGFDDRVVYADRFTSNGGRNDVAADRLRNAHTGADQNPYAWSQARRTMPSQDEWARAVVEAVSAGATDLVVRTLDVDDAMPDPPELELRPAI